MPCESSGRRRRRGSRRDVTPVRATGDVAPRAPLTRSPPATPATARHGRCTAWRQGSGEISGVGGGVDVGLARLLEHRHLAGLLACCSASIARRRRASSMVTASLARATVSTSGHQPPKRERAFAKPDARGADGLSHGRTAGSRSLTRLKSPSLVAVEGGSSCAGAAQQRVVRRRECSAGPFALVWRRSV